MADNNNVIPYLAAFIIILLMIAVLCGPKLARAARILMILYLPFALGLSIYYLGFKRSTWQEGSAATLSDPERYSRAVKRSSAVYLVINLILFAGAKVFGYSYNSVGYNFVSLFMTTMITYVYDRCVSTDDGLMHLKQDPGTTIYDAYLSICSPSFLRYLVAITCEITLSVMIAYFIGQLIPPHCWVANAVFRKSIVPVFVFSIVGGPLRFAWAYPTVSEGSRISYLLAYTIAFSLLGMIAYTSGSLDPTSAVGVLIMVAVIAMILQLGGLSNAAHDPDVVRDASEMPTWLMTILATVILISVLVIAYRIFAGYLHPYLLLTVEATKKEIAKMRHNVEQRNCRVCL